MTSTNRELLYLIILNTLKIFTINNPIASTSISVVESFVPYIDLSDDSISKQEKTLKDSFNSILRKYKMSEDDQRELMYLFACQND